MAGKITLEDLQAFEGKTEEQQADLLLNVLNKLGTCEVKPIKTRSGLTTIIHSSTGYTLILKNSYPILMKKDDYEKYVEGKSIWLKTGGEYNERLVPVLGQQNIPLHQIVAGLRDVNGKRLKTGDVEVDHISFSLSIAVPEMLRLGHRAQNHMNKNFRCKQNNKFTQFTCDITISGVSDNKVQYLQSEGFTIIQKNKKYHIASPVYVDKDEMYQAIHDFETFVFGIFAYDIMKDYSADAYSYILFCMLGADIFPAETLSAYHRDFIARKAPEKVKEYYKPVLTA